MGALSAIRVREVLDYDPETGIFVGRINLGPKIKVGKAAGGFSDRGYWRISIDGQKYLAHRLAWLYMTGEWPPDQTDHINGNRADNRWANLRSANGRQNQGNMKVPKHNTSGIKGVHWDRARGKWMARIKVNRKSTHLGRFDTPEAAAAAYAEAARKHWGEFARVT